MRATRDQAASRGATLGGLREIRSALVDRGRTERHDGRDGGAPDVLRSLDACRYSHSTYHKEFLGLKNPITAGNSHLAQLHEVPSA